jgi:uncharacterized membrane-anchored protein
MTQLLAVICLLAFVWKIWDETEGIFNALLAALDDIAVWIGVGSVVDGLLSQTFGLAIFGALWYFLYNYVSWRSQKSKRTWFARKFRNDLAGVAVLLLAVIFWNWGSNELGFRMLAVEILQRTLGLLT